MDTPYDDLVALTNRIASDGDAIKAAGISLHHWGPNRQGSAVAMFVRSEAEPAQSYMDMAYSSGKVIVRHTDDPPAQRC